MKKKYFLFPIVAVLLIAGITGAICPNPDTHNLCQDDSSVQGSCDTLPVTGTSCKADSAMLNIPRIGPCSVNWCWAACGQMCMKFIDPATAPLQCQMAEDYFSTDNCCFLANGTHCDSFSHYPCPCRGTGWPPLCDFGFSADTTTNTPLTVNQIIYQISCLQRPVMFSWYFGTDNARTSASGHMMVIKGYKVINRRLWLYINDPDRQCTVISYNQYLQGNGYVHWNDYYNISEVNSSAFAAHTKHHHQ